MKEDILFRVALTTIPGLGSILSKKLINHFGSGQEVFNQPYHSLTKVYGIGNKTAESIVNIEDYIVRAEGIVTHCNDNNIDILFHDNPIFPYKLNHIHDSPTLLYYSGNHEALRNPSIAIVGTRNATNYGKAVVQEIIQQLQITNCTIVSGLAYGIDVEAHIQCIEKRIPTIGIMANGLDMVYPSLHTKTANLMCEQGGIMSEFPPGEKPDPGRFPARNRIIAGMTDVTIVVEAAGKGGALITAEMANDYNREVFAVPGNINNKYSVGCNKLIQQNKAHIFTSVEDLFNMLNWRTSITSDQICSPIDINTLNLSEQKKDILNEISSIDNIQLDMISWNTGIALNKLVGLLLELELENYITSLPGNVYKLNNSFSSV